MSSRGWEGYQPTVPSPPTRRLPLSTRAVEAGLAKRESEIQAECEAWIRGEMASGGIVEFYHARSPRQDRAGFLDLTIGVRPGLVIAVELKAPLGETTREQERWLAAWGEQGCVARSCGEMVEFVKRWRDSQ